MTPKEKAEDLVYKMWREVPSHYDDENIAKQCALIAVDEIIENQYDLTSQAFDDYWQEVKQEIENL